MRHLADTLRPPAFERTHPLAESAVLLKDGSTISAEKLAQRFYDSELGKAMPSQPLRYETKYGYDREQMRRDLGHDVCPVGHQRELAYHLGAILQDEIDHGTIYGNLDESELGVLLFTSMVHDAGETTHPSITTAGLTPVGDIPAGRKTPADRANEAAVRAYIWQTIYSDVDPETMQRVEAIIAHTDDSLLHDYFEAAHTIQSLETSNFAYRALSRQQWYKNGEVINVSSDDGSRLSGLLGIARVTYESTARDVKEYSHFTYIQAVATQTERLRNHPHTLLNSLYS